MRVLVTGGAGFIGSHIVDVLIDHGHEPFVLDDLSSGSPRNLPRDAPLFNVDIRDEEAVQKIFREVQPRWVTHQAAQMSVSLSMREPKFDADVNVLGLINVLSAAQAAGVERFAFASSGGALYGDVAEPASEDHPAAPISPYGITKWVGERYLQFYASRGDMNCVALRYSNVYGPRQNPHGEAGVVAIFSTRSLRGETITINGDGRYIRDYVYVEDVARANYAALTAHLEHPFAAVNIGTAQPTDVNQLAELIQSAARAELSSRGIDRDVPEPQYGPHREGDLRSSLLNPAQADAILGWRPRVSLQDGLQHTVAWFARRELQAAAKSRP